MNRPGLRAGRAPRASGEWGAALLERALGLLVAALPFGVALSRVASSGQWRDDLPAVRDLGLVSVGVGGGLSTIAAQALSIVPLGSRTFRASVGSALALALAAWLTYRLALRALRAAMPLPIPARPAPPGTRARRAWRGPRRGKTRPAGSRLAALLAAIAALTASLSPAWQLEGTIGGGAMWAACAGLGAVLVALDCAGPNGRSARAWILLGALTGAAFAESPAAGLCGAAAAAVALVVPRLQAGLLDRADRAAASSCDDAWTPRRTSRPRPCRRTARSWRPVGPLS